MEVHDALLSALAAVIAVTWLPVLRRFYRAWQVRRSPISLAICATIMLHVYVNVLLVLVISFGANVHWALAGGTLFNGLASGNFYLCLRWAKRKYRRESNTPSVR